MVSNSVLFNLFKYLGIILVFVSIYLLVKQIKKFRGDKKDLFTKEFLFNKKIIIYFTLFVSGFSLNILSYYFNPTTYEYLSTIHVHPKFINIVLIFLTSVLLGTCIFVLGIIFARKYFFEFIEKKKKENLFLLISVILVVVCFYLFSLTNSEYLQYPLCNRVYIGTKGILLVTNGTGNDWNPAPTDGFGIQIAWYAIIIGCGAILAFLICDYKLRKEYKQSELLFDAFLIGLPTGIIGARVWYVIGNWERGGYNTDFGAIFRIWDGGLTIMGASFGLLCALLYFLYAKYKKETRKYKDVSLLKVFDFIAPSVLLAQGIGRYGNFMNNEVHGVVVDSSKYSWLPKIITNNMAYSSGHYGVTLTSGSIYNPLFFIESVINICGYFFIAYVLLTWLRNITINFKGNKIIKSSLRILTAEGTGFGYYLIWYGLTRIIMEPLRDTAFNMGTDNKWSSKSAWVMFIVGICFVLLMGVWQLLRDNGKFIIKVKENKNGSK